MSFSERNKIIPEKQIQLNDIDDALRNRILNLFLAFIGNYPSEGYILDRLGYQNTYFLNIVLRDCQWNVIYDTIEYGYEHIEICHADNSYKQHLRTEEYTNSFNRIFEQEKSGYRIINGQISPITSKTEISSILESQKTKFDSVNTHMSKALQLYSKRQNPDYENSIKESISAVEAMCCIITGLDGKTATLGEALKCLEEKNIKIHNALKEAFKKLYGYTSDANGIRHGGIDFINASPEDAKYMLVSCSAFINYLKEKLSK